MVQEVDALATEAVSSYRLTQIAFRIERDLDNICGLINELEATCYVDGLRHIYRHMSQSMTELREILNNENEPPEEHTE